MKLMNSDPQIRKTKRFVGLFMPVLAGGFAISACSSAANRAPALPANTSDAPAASATPNTSAQGQPVTITFDDLGSSSSSIIEVYPGVKDTLTDKTYNGTFKSGQTAVALCKTAGREVTSDPSAHERPVSTNIWVQIMGSPGETQYATLTYATISAQGLERLSACPNPQ